MKKQLRDHVVNMRMTKDERDLIEVAAKTLNKSRNSFVVEAAKKAAMHVFQKADFVPFEESFEESGSISREEWDYFLDRLGFTRSNDESRDSIIHRKG